MKIAAVFPGQGSQTQGMLAELSAQFPVVGETFSRASDLLGYDVWALVQQGSEEQLRQTELTQPIMFVSGMAVWNLWRQLDVEQPQLLAGHSLGEFTALAAAGVFSFETALSLVVLRSKLMASCVAPGVGGMAALLGMEDQSVRELCESLTKPDAVVEAVNFNSPGQVVISGHLTAIEQACVLARENGAKKAMLLPVSVPNHSSLMEPAKAELAAAIDAAKVQQGDLGIVQNLTACVALNNEVLLDVLKKHVVSPVYWTDTVRYFSANGVTAIVELGPGKVLAGLCKRVDRSLLSLPVENSASLKKALDNLVTEQV